MITGIRETAAGSPCVEKVNEVLTMHMGPEFVLVNVSVAFAPDARAEQVAAAVAAIDRDLKGSWPEIRRVFIEGEARAGAARG